MKNTKTIRKLLFVILVCIVVFAGITYCVDHAGDGEATGALSAVLATLNEADPAQDVSVQVREGDMRFVGLMGVGPYFPGLSADRMPNQLDPTSYRILDGTTDALESRHHARLIERAKRYAMRFNSELQSRMPSSTKDDLTAE